MRAQSCETLDLGADRIDPQSTQSADVKAIDMGRRQVNIDSRDPGIDLTTRMFCSPSPVAEAFARMTRGAIMCLRLK